MGRNLYGPKAGLIYQSEPKLSSGPRPVPVYESKPKLEPDSIFLQVGTSGESDTHLQPYSHHFFLLLLHSFKVLLDLLNVGFSSPIIYVIAHTILNDILKLDGHILTTPKMHLIEI